MASKQSSARGASAPRVALRVDEAAAALGLSRRSFERHVLGDLRVVYVGRARLVPVDELRDWAARRAVAVR